MIPKLIRVSLKVLRVSDFEVDQQEMLARKMILSDLKGGMDPKDIFNVEETG